MNSTGERIIQSPVPEEFNGWRLDKYLAARFTYYSRSRWSDEIRSGKILKNGNRDAVPGARVKANDLISFDPGVMTEPEVDFSYTVLFEDKFLIAVNKSGNLPVHPSGRFFKNTLLTDLEKRLGHKMYPAHRLDRETSGVILFGKDPATASGIQKSFTSAVKTYIAIIKGRPLVSVFTVDASLGKEEGAIIEKKQGTRTIDGKKALTEFSVLHTGESHALIKACPKTGRYHQIRAHLEHAGYPIVGDKLYGGDAENYLRFVNEGYTDELTHKLGFYRTALHARSLRFTHPVTKKIMLVKASLPPDMRELILNLFDF